MIDPLGVATDGYITSQPARSSSFCIATIALLFVLLGGPELPQRFQTYAPVGDRESITQYDRTLDQRIHRDDEEIFAIIRTFLECQT